jgi:hypothetical protein
LILAEYEEMPLEAIGRATDAEVAAVKCRLHCARENLRRMACAAAGKIRRDLLRNGCGPLPLSEGTGCVCIAVRN